MSTLVEWLASLPNVSNVTPVTVTIGRETFHGARYLDTRQWESGMAAVQRGERKAGETYQLEFIYLLGGLPAAYRRSTRVAFNFADDRRDWYVACYHDGGQRRIGDHVTPKPPFGANFMLAPWTCPDAIDRFDIMSGKKPYRRVAATVGVEQ